MDLSSFTADYPYPKITLANKDPEIAQMMLNNCADNTSEMSSVALYFYDQIVTENEPNVSKAFKDIMETEWKHLTLFADLAFQAGADPRLWTVIVSGTQRRLDYWNPSRLPYSQDKKTLLNNALALERASIEKYENQTRTIKNETLMLVMRRVLLDEQLHIEMFRALLGEKL
jgi:bacterioferritin